MNPLAVPPGLLVVAAVVALGVLVACVRRVLRLVGTPPLARVPLAAEQDVELPEAGPVVLWGEGPRFTRRFSGLDFTLADRELGRDVPLRRVLLPVTVSGWRNVRVSLRRGTVERPGRYRLRIGGLTPGSDLAGHAISLSRPTGPALPISIVGIVFSAIVLVGSSVLYVLERSGVALESAGGGDAAQPASVPVRDERAGRALRADRGTVPRWQTVDWPAAHARLEIPADWEQRKATPEELDLRAPRTPSTYVVAHTLSASLPVPPAQLLAIHRNQAADRLANGDIDGWAVRTLGTVPGILTLERGKSPNHAMAWIGIVPTATGSSTVTVLFGSADPAHDEPLLGAILESARFGG